MPVTINTAMLTTCPFIRIFSYIASTHSTGYTSSRGRLRKASTCSFSPLLISLTWLADSVSISKDLASFSILRVDTPLINASSLDHLDQRLLRPFSLYHEEGHIPTISKLLHHEIQRPRWCIEPSNSVSGKVSVTFLGLDSLFFSAPTLDSASSCISCCVSYCSIASSFSCSEKNCSISILKHVIKLSRAIVFTSVMVF